MEYTLHQLRIFLKVSETQSITKAAEALHLTQPAVSIQLKKLQEQFDVPLTEVIGRQLYITPFGKEIAEASERILDEVHAIKYKTMAFRGHLVGTLRVSTASTAKYVMPYFLSGFLTEHDGIDLVMDVTNKTQVIQSLENNEVDFAMVSVLPENITIDKVELMQNKLYLVGKPGLSKGKVNRAKLAQLPLIYREQGSATRQAMERFIMKNDILVKKKMELTSNEAVKQAVIAGLGFSVMPLIGIKHELTQDDLEVIPIKGLPITTHWYLVWLKGKQFSPIAKEYLRWLEEHKDEIMRRQFSWSEAY